MKVIGHRGAAGEAPENTVAGFRHAISRGCIDFELDINLSADGEMMVIHDGTVNRTTAAKGAVSRFSAAQLQRMDARRNTALWPRKRDCSIPVLQQVLEATPEAHSFQLEVKKGSSRTMRRVAGLLAAQFPTVRSAKRVTVTSMSVDLHHHLRELAPHLRRGLVTVERDAHKLLKDDLYHLLVLAWPVCTPAVVRGARKQSVPVSVWTVNNPDTVKQMHKIGVDSVITDYPSMALPLVARLNAN